jgi:ferrochelatase
MSAGNGDRRGNAANSSCDSVMLIGFGGPTDLSEVRPFLDRVLQGRPVPPERYEEVVHHYELLGGRSPYNDLTMRQAAALRDVLRRDGIEVPLAIGMRNTPPFIDDALRELAAKGARRTFGFILAAHRCEASWDRYQRDVDITMAARSPYVEQITESAEMVAAAVGNSNWRIAYQSRSGSPRHPWLAPDVNQMLREFGGRSVVVVPIGFLCDHVEVLYDLDIEAAQIAREAGVTMVRAATVSDHPRFIEMIATLARAHLATSPATPPAMRAGG